MSLSRFFDTFWEWWCTPDTPDSPSSTGSEPECGSGSECDDGAGSCFINAKSPSSTGSEPECGSGSECGFGSECDDEVIQCLINAKSSANQVCKLSYTSSSETIDIAEISESDSDGEAGPSFWNAFWEWWCTPDTPDSPSPSP